MSARLCAATCSLALLFTPGVSAAAQMPAPRASPTPAVRGAASAPAAPPDIFFLVDGDRITGRTLSRGRRAFVVRTPYGRLTLPRSKVARIVWGDGREETLHAAPTAAPAPAPATPSVATLVLAIRGRSFWHAWDRREPVDATLRLQVWLDEQELATYTDAMLDPQDLPGATVNSFSFAPADVSVTAGAGLGAQPPDTRPGRVTLRLELPASPDAQPSPARRLRLAYQINSATPDEPAWRDVAGTALDVSLSAGATTVVEVAQDAGRMEFSGLGRKRMKHVESFQLTAHTALDSPVPQP